MQKTVVVQVEHVKRHPLYKKVVTSFKKHKARVEDIDLAEGDMVTIVETRPVSKDTHFKVLKKVTKKS